MPPATDREIRLAQERLGVRLPRELVELLRGHNGARGFVLPPYFEVLGTNQLVDSWERRVQIWGAREHTPFLSRYLPFAVDGAGGVLYVDTGVPVDSRIHEHDVEGGASTVTAHPMWSSLTSLMHHTADALESGEPLDCWVRPGEGSGCLLWEEADDEDGTHPDSSGLSEGRSSTSGPLLQQWLASPEASAGSLGYLVAAPEPGEAEENPQG
ncbi:SMI1/KNR4 family protein [Streptomyces aculeolatus]